MSEIDAFEQAIRVLDDPARSGEWQEAVAAIDQAAEGGNAEACERRAFLEARGAFRIADWGQALDWLAAGAAAGSTKAARQLLILADDRLEPQSLDTRAVDSKAARNRVDMARRLRPPGDRGRLLSNDPIVHAIGAMASAAECGWLVEMAGPKLGRAEIYGKAGKANEGRTNRAARLSFVNSDLVAEMLRHRIANTLGAPISFFEVAQVLSYQPGEEFVLHRDSLDPAHFAEDIARFGQRQATALVYLNEDFEGGETSFPKLGIEHRGKAGDALIFANIDRAGLPEARSEHAGRPPTSGVKWVFSQWIRNRPLG